MLAAVSPSVDKLKPKSDAAEERGPTRSSADPAIIPVAPTTRLGKQLSPRRVAAGSEPVVFPGLPPITITDGTLHRFESMTSPVDLMNRQLRESRKRQQQALKSLQRASGQLNGASPLMPLDSVKLSPQLEQPAESTGYSLIAGPYYQQEHLNGLQALGPKLQAEESNYATGNVSTARRHSAPVPMVANHFNLVMFTKQNVTGNLLELRGESGELAGQLSKADVGGQAEEVQQQQQQQAPQSGAINAIVEESRQGVGVSDRWPKPSQLLAMAQVRGPSQAKESEVGASRTAQTPNKQPEQQQKSSQKKKKQSTTTTTTTNATATATATTTTTTTQVPPTASTSTLSRGSVAVADPKDADEYEAADSRLSETIAMPPLKGRKMHQLKTEQRLSWALSPASTRTSSNSENRHSANDYVQAIKLVSGAARRAGRPAAAPLMQQFKK